MFLVLEIKTNNNNNVETNITTHKTRNEADSAFYQIMSIAAVSNIEKYAVMILDNEGACLRTACYKNGNEE